MELTEILKPFFRDVLNFPKEGIVFKDITPLLANPSARSSVVRAIASHFVNQEIEAVAAVEARGFIFGALIANELNVPFIPVRKAGKLPYKKRIEEYSLEYGTAIIEMHEDAITNGQRVLIHDDLLATGGTATAAGNLVRKTGGIVSGYSFVVNLSFLPGEHLLKERFGLQPHYLVKF